MEGDAVVRRELVLKDLAEDRERGSGSDRRIQDEHPGGQESHDRPQGLAHIGEIAARGRECPGEFHETDAERNDDQQADEIGQRRHAAGNAHQCLGEEESRDRRGDMRHVLHDRTGEAHRPRLQLGNGDVGLAFGLDEPDRTRVCVLGFHGSPLHLSFASLLAINALCRVPD